MMHWLAVGALLAIAIVLQVGIAIAYYRRGYDAGFDDGFDHRPKVDALRRWPVP